MKRHEHKKIALCAHQNHRRMHHILHIHSPITRRWCSRSWFAQNCAVRIENDAERLTERTQAVYNLGRLEINYWISGLCRGVCASDVFGAQSPTQRAPLFDTEGWNEWRKEHAKSIRLMLLSLSVLCALSAQRHALSRESFIEKIIIARARGWNVNVSRVHFNWERRHSFN